MALIVKDRVKESTTTTGTADFTLGGAASGFQTFAIIGNTNTTYYAAVDQATGAWEVGIGTYSSTGPTLTRDTVLESSNSGSKVNFAAGSKDVFCTYPAERSVYLDAAGSAVSVLDIGTLGVSTANISTANITAGTVSTTPTNNTDLVNKTYVDTLVASGIHFHQPVRVESPINLNATYNNGTAGVGATLTNAGTQVALVIDGVTVATNDRVLVYQQTTQTQNGIYVVTNTGSGSTNWVLTRASDANTYVINSANGLSEGSTVFVQQGATGAGETYTCNTSGTITFGTTNITFAQISSAQIYSAGTGLTLSSTQFSITNVGTAGTYGSASSVPVLAINAQGQVTSATPTAIAIAAAAVSGLAASATTNTTIAGNISSGTLPAGRLSGSYTGITGVGTLTTGIWSASTIAATRGGTGLTSFAQGDLLYAASSTTVGRLADVVAGNALLSGGVGGDPAWGKVGLDTHVTGTLPVGNGGTGATTLTGYVFGNGTGAFTASTSIPNSATTATDLNTASAIVARDASGNFTAGTITASLNGNASTATTAANVNNGTLTMAVSGTGLSGSATFTANQSGNSTFTVTSNATNANTAGAIVARDGSGNFSAGTITATLSGNASTATSATSATTATNLSGGTVSATTGSFSGLLTPTGGIANGAVFNNAGTFEGGELRLQRGTSSALNGDLVFDLAGSTVRFFEAGGTNRGAGFDITTQAASAGSVILTSTTSAASFPTLNQNTTGNAATATALQTARNIGGVSFNGTANINLPGVNTAGNQNTSGNAATATALSSGQSNWSGTGVLNNVVGLMAWKNYGNSHVIFDASNSTTPSGTSCNNTNAQVAWGGSYPTLMGWNGANTYGVRVDSARVADSATSATTATTATTATNATNASNITGGTISGNYIINNATSPNSFYLQFGDNTGWTYRFMTSVSGTPTTRFSFVDNGNFTAVGNVTAYSDERLKKDWAPLAENFVEELATVKSGTYTRIDSEERQAGSSAQDWQKLLPEVVIANEDEDKTLALAYGNAALVSVVELAKRVVEQDTRIAKLEALVAQLIKGNTP